MPSITMVSVYINTNYDDIQDYLYLFIASSSTLFLFSYLFIHFLSLDNGRYTF